MPFMEPQAVFLKMITVETTDGTERVPVSVPSAYGDVAIAGSEPTPESLSQYLEGKPLLDDEGDFRDISEEEGWYARFSAPGYLDCTDYIGPQASAEAALDDLAEMHDCCRECWEQCWDGDNPCKPEPGEENESEE